MPSRSTPRVIVPKPGGRDPLQASPSIRRPVAAEMGERPRPWDAGKTAPTTAKPAPVSDDKPPPSWPSPVRSMGGGGHIQHDRTYTPPWAAGFHKRVPEPSEPHRTPAWKESPIHEMMSVFARLGGDVGEIGQGSPFLGDPKTYSAFEE